MSSAAAAPAAALQVQVPAAAAPAASRCGRFTSCCQSITAARVSTVFVAIVASAVLVYSLGVFVGTASIMLQKPVLVAVANPVIAKVGQAAAALLSLACAVGAVEVLRRLVNQYNSSMLGRGPAAAGAAQPVAAVAVQPAAGAVQPAAVAVQPAAGAVQPAAGVAQPAADAAQPAADAAK